MDGGPKKQETMVLAEPRVVVAIRDTFYMRHGKRVMDVALALVLLPILLPVMCADCSEHGPQGAVHLRTPARRPDTAVNLPATSSRPWSSTQTCASPKSCRQTPMRAQSGPATTSCATIHGSRASAASCARRASTSCRSFGTSCEVTCPSWDPRPRDARRAREIRRRGRGLLVRPPGGHGSVAGLGTRRGQLHGARHARRRLHRGHQSGPRRYDHRPDGPRAVEDVGAVNGVPSRGAHCIISKAADDPEKLVQSDMKSRERNATERRCLEYL